MTKRNPKQVGSVLFDCKTQIGFCPMNCSQCFANRVNKCPDCSGTGKLKEEQSWPDGLCIGRGGKTCPKCKGTGKIGAAYISMDKQILPTPEEVGDGIVRANCLHDSNFGRAKLIEHCKRYKKVFYNTSIPNFDFPDPVVFTANRKEEDPAFVIRPVSENLMYVRLRVSSSNLFHVKRAVKTYTQELRVPVVLTFMAYYDDPPDLKKSDRDDYLSESYIYKVRHINSYWCPKDYFMRQVMKIMKPIGGRLLTMCGTPDSYWCRDCQNCETYYYQTIRHMRGY